MTEGWIDRHIGDWDLSKAYMRRALLEGSDWGANLFERFYQVVRTSVDRMDADGRLREDVDRLWLPLLIMYMELGTLLLEPYVEKVLGRSGFDRALWRRRHRAYMDLIYRGTRPEPKLNICSVERAALMICETKHVTARERMTRIEDIFEANRGKYARQLACKTIHRLLASHAETIPDREAAIDGEQRLSYADVARDVDRIAKALIASGIMPGDRVATMVPPSLEFWLTYLATASIGAIWMGLNPRYQLPEYAYLLNDAQPSLVFCRPSTKVAPMATSCSRSGPTSVVSLPLAKPRAVRLPSTPFWRQATV